MLAGQVVQLLCKLPYSKCVCLQVVQLLSKLPPNPIETPAPDVWAWGRHPNGLDYKARDEGGADIIILSINQSECRRN